MLIVLAALIVVPIANAQDKAAYQQARAKLAQVFGDSKATHADRASAIRAIGDAIYPDVDKDAVDTVIGLLQKEIAKGKNGKFEQKVSGDVLEACGEVVGQVTSDKAIETVCKYISKKGFPWRIKFYLIDGIGGKNDPRVAEALKTVITAKKEDPRSRLAAIRAAGKHDSGQFVDAVTKALDGPQWEIKEAALKAIEAWGDDKAVDALIDMLSGLKDDEGRVKELAIDILESLSGISREDVGDYYDSSSWKGPWGRKKAGNEPIPSGGPDGGGGGTSIEIPPTTYYGIKTRSTRIVFCLDITGSMMEPATDSSGPEEDEPENDPNDVIESGSDPNKRPNPQVEAARKKLKEKKKEHDNRTVSTKIDAAKKKLINTLYFLNEKVHFTIVFYSGGADYWKETLVPATMPNKLAAIESIEKKAAGGPTNIFSALELAFKLTEKGAGKNKVIVRDDKGNYAEMLGGADTFFLLTDGKANTGRIFEPDQIRSEVKKINKLREVTIHTIGVGNDLDSSFLSGLASDNNGNFVHVK
jgi:hypothetical protein